MQHVSKYCLKLFFCKALHVPCSNANTTCHNGLSCLASRALRRPGRQRACRRSSIVSPHNIETLHGKNFTRCVIILSSVIPPPPSSLSAAQSLLCLHELRMFLPQLLPLPQEIHRPFAAIPFCHPGTLPPDQSPPVVSLYLLLNFLGLPALL